MKLYDEPMINYDFMSLLCNIKKDSKGDELSVYCHKRLQSVAPKGFTFTGMTPHGLSFEYINGKFQADVVYCKEAFAHHGYMYCKYQQYKNKKKVGEEKFLDIKKYLKRENDLYALLRWMKKEVE